MCSPLPFIIIPQVPVFLFAIWLFLTWWQGVLITCPHPAPPVGQKIKVASVNGPPPPGLQDGNIYTVIWSRGNSFRMREPWRPFEWIVNLWYRLRRKWRISK